eukprot:scaffold4715_cov115-Cylindrotheca_fusiformis.AAC.14
MDHMNPNTSGCLTCLDRAGFDYNAKEEVDRLLSQSMTELSFQERQMEQEDLHGVRPQLSEDAEMIQRLVDELDEHLNKLKAGTAYEAAESTDSAYVKSVDFRLMFLRCNEYDPQASAAHIVKFMDTKLKLFGKAKLVQDITLKDLDEDDREVVRNGHLQVLRGCDRSGRRIFLEYPALRSFKSLMNELRARFYIYMDGAKSPEAQHNGAVLVTYGVGTLRERLRGIGFVENAKVALSLPLRYAGLHLATDNLGHYVLLKGALAITPAKLRTRFKLHHGSHMECQYELNTYGMARELLPLTEDDEAILEYHLSWYNTRLLEEGGDGYVRWEESSNKQIDEPQPHDVLFGRKRSNTGNKRVRQLVAALSPEYDSAATKVRKRQIASSVVEEIQNTGGRFLMQPDGTDRWEEVPNLFARNKIMKHFQNQRRTSKSSASEGPSESDS